MTWLALALLQDLDLRVTRTHPEVTLSVATDEPVIVRRRAYWFEGGRIVETWIEESGTLEASEVKLSGPGHFEIAAGGRRARISVTHDGFAAWDRQVRTLREGAQRLSELAAQIDRTPGPTREQIRAWRKKLQAERERLAALQTEFTASRRALEDAVDRLYFFRTLLADTGRPDEEALGLYQAPAKVEKPAKAATAADEIRPMLEILPRETALVLVDELLQLAQTAGHRVVRWNNIPAACDAILKICPEDFKPLVQEVREGADGIADKLRQRRAQLLK